MTTPRIYLSPPWLSGTEIDALTGAVDSNWIAPVGPELDAFEAELASVSGAAAAVAVASGTAAIHLALRSVGVREGDVVIIPSFTFIGSANPVGYLGAEPWFIDSEAASWNLDPALITEAFEAARAEGRRVGAVVAVDLFGQCANYDEIEAICDASGVPLVEDAAEALGASYRDRPAGSLGRIGVFSFNGNKIVTTSAGGALVSDDVELIGRCRFLSTQAREPAVHYEHREVGYNYRMSNLLAAVGRAQLSTLSERVENRRRVFRMYEERLAGADGIDFMPEPSWSRSNRWLTTLTVDTDRFGATPSEIIDALETRNIEARPVWKPMHLQPVYAGSRMFGGATSETLFRNGLCLPSGTGMSEADVDRVVEGVLAARC